MCESLPDTVSFILYTCKYNLLKPMGSYKQIKKINVIITFVKLMENAR